MIHSLSGHHLWSQSSLKNVTMVLKKQKGPTAQMTGQPWRALTIKSPKQLKPKNNFFHESFRENEKQRKYGRQ